MELIRVGDKVISRDKLVNLVNKILQLRAKGSTQSEVAKKIGVDRSFISHLEGLGEIRKGKRVALVGFPVANKEEIEKLALEKGVDFVYLLGEEERYQFVESRSGVELFNEILELIAFLKDFDVIVFLGSDWRISIAEKIFGDKVIGVKIGRSPIKESIDVDLNKLGQLLLESLPRKKRWEVFVERSRQRKFRLFKKRSQR